MALTQEQLNNYYNNIVPENFNPFPNQPAPAPAPAPAPTGDDGGGGVPSAEDQYWADRKIADDAAAAAKKLS